MLNFTLNVVEKYVILLCKLLNIIDFREFILCYIKFEKKFLLKFMIYYRTFFYLATMRTFGGTFPQPRSSWSLNVRPFIFLTASHLHLHVLALKMSNVIIIVSNDWKNFPPCTFLRKEDIFFLLCLNPVARGTHTSEPAWGSVRLRMVESWLESPPLESCFSRLK